MGGNAIKNARRIDKSEYDQILVELDQLLPELNFLPVKAYYTKEDFGDIDLVVSIQKDKDLRQLIRDRLSPIDEYDNGPFFSISYKDIQVDFIFMHEDEYISALNYFHWNDLGNFIGRVARSLNFKYGHDGLSYDKHYSDHYKVSIPVSKDIKEILEFLGYDYSKWEAGFDKKEDIFAYVMTTPYFNATYFSLDEQAHNDRVRNRKRKMYQLFLEYIENLGIENKPKLTEDGRMVHYKRAIDIFGHNFDEAVKYEQEKYNLQLKVKELFNGDIVSEKTGLKGKELGIFIQRLKSSENNLNTRIIEGGSDFVEELILKHYNIKYGESNENI